MNCRLFEGKNHMHSFPQKHLYPLNIFCFDTLNNRCQCVSLSIPTTDQLNITQPDFQK